MSSALLFSRARPILTRRSVRFFTNAQQYDGLVLGAYTDGKNGVVLPAAKDISAATQSHLIEQLAASNFKKSGDVRLLYNVGGVKQVAVVSLGPKPAHTSKTNPITRQAHVLETARNAVSRIYSLPYPRDGNTDATLFNDRRLLGFRP